MNKMMIAQVRRCRRCVSQNKKNSNLNFFERERERERELERERESMAHGNFADFIGICVLAIGCVSIFLQDVGLVVDRAFLKVRFF